MAGSNQVAAPDEEKPEEKLNIIGSCLNTLNFHRTSLILKNSRSKGAYIVLRVIGVGVGVQSCGGLLLVTGLRGCQLVAVGLRVLEDETCADVEERVRGVVLPDGPLGRGVHPAGRRDHSALPHLLGRQPRLMLLLVSMAGVMVVEATVTRAVVQVLTIATPETITFS